MGRTMTNQAIGHYLRGCANVAMARTPRQALAALHKTQASLLRHSGDAFARVARLWHKQTADRLVVRAEDALRPREPGTETRSRR